MGTNRSTFGDLLEPGMRKVFFDVYKAIPQKYNMIFNVSTSTKQDETDTAVTGFGLFDNTTEGEPLQYEDPLQGYDVSYVHQSYKKGFKITEEMYDDDQYNVMKRMPSQLATGANRTIEVVAAGILNYGFGTTKFTGGDGVALFSAAHTRVDGGASQSNTVSGGSSALTESAIKTARKAMRTTLDDKGQLITVIPDTLIVPPALDETAHIIINSQGRTGTANLNELNPYKDMFNIIVWDYLGAAVSGGSDTAWFLLDRKITELQFFWRKQLNFGQDESFSTDEALFKAKMRFSVGFSGWRGIYGSAGV